ncbi:MAG: sterol transfer family [Candidatus Binatota bacterium]|nr:sterol transfer family [Candidatus Binatota bacterium]
MTPDDADKPFRPEEVLTRQVVNRVSERVAQLRARIESLQRDLRDHLEARATLRIVLEGDGGGEWYVNVEGGAATLANAAAAPPLLTVYQKLDDFRLAAAAGAVGGLGFGGPAGQGALTRSRIERLQAIRGTLEIKVTDLPDGKELPVTIHFGSGERDAQPQTVIALKAEDAERLRKGELNPQMAFLQGRIRMTGDAALAMQIGMAMM